MQHDQIHPENLPHGFAPVAGIEPVDGYLLIESEEQDGDGFWHPVYLAVKGEETHQLHVSRFNFTPTQERFDWLVRWGFPRAYLVGLSRGGPLTDTIIDNAIAGERRATMPELRSREAA